MGEIFRSMSFVKIKFQIKDQGVKRDIMVFVSYYVSTKFR